MAQFGDRFPAQAQSICKINNKKPLVFVKTRGFVELLPGFGPGTSSLPRGEGEGLDDGISPFRPLRVLKKVLNCSRPFSFACN